MKIMTNAWIKTESDRVDSNKITCKIREIFIVTEF